MGSEGDDIALAAAGHQVALRESRAECAICGRRALVTGLESNHDRSPAERVLLFLLDHRGRVFCHVGIARRLELNIGTVQKAVGDLRRTSDVRVADARCSQWGRSGSSSATATMASRQDSRTSVE